MDSEKNRNPIFIVGPSRSGTALVRSILNEHPNINIAGETHYFDDLRVKLKDASKVPVPKESRVSCEDYFMALTHRPYGHQGVAELGDLSRKSLSGYAENLGCTGDSYFEAYCTIQAEKHGKCRWGEKTPRHVYRIAEILQCFPKANIICLMRDPRAVVSSYKNWKNQGGFDFEADPGHREALKDGERRSKRSYHVITASIMCKSAAGAAESAVERFGDERVRIVKYEDVVENSLDTVKELCEWLDEEFFVGMLHVPVHNSSFMTYTKKSGIVSGSLDRWKERLTKQEVGVIEWLCRRLMASWGYQRTSTKMNWSSVATACVTWPVSVIAAVAANRNRIGNLWDYVARRLGFAFFR